MRSSSVLSPTGVIRRWNSLLGRLSGRKLHVWSDYMQNLVANEVCRGKYTNSVINNKGYCTTRVRYESIENPVGPIDLCTTWGQKKKI